MNKGKLTADQRGRPLHCIVKTIELGTRKLMGQGVFDIGEMGRQSDHIQSMHRGHLNHLADADTEKPCRFVPVSIFK